jgi:hypothetical protein
MHVLLIRGNAHSTSDTQNADPVGVLYLCMPCLPREGLFTKHEGSQHINAAILSLFMDSFQVSFVGSKWLQ